MESLNLEMPQRYLDEVINQMNFQEKRREETETVKIHPTKPIEIDGKFVNIDEDFVPVLNWFLSHKVKTQWCCQGDVRKNKENNQPYIIWTCDDSETVEKLLKFFSEFENHYIVNMCTTPYFEIHTKIEYFCGEIRYNTKWYDNITLKDFVKFINNT